MFAVSKRKAELSPTQMKFGEFWIYDLRAFHTFWRQLVQDQNDVVVSDTVWNALLSAYGIHLFAPLVQLIPFARDFHKHYPDLRGEMSEKKIKEVFQIFAHLGLKKVEHLKRFSRDDIQKRFGRNWGIFFQGVLTPQTPWTWYAYREPEVLSTTFEFEDFCIDAALLLQEMSRALLHLSKDNPRFALRKLQVTFVLSQGNEFFRTQENEIHLSFTYEPLLEKDFGWILKLIEKRLYEMHFDYPIWKFELDLYPAGAKSTYQLSLFKNKQEEMNWYELCQKLADQNFCAFEPAPTFSYLPEKCWQKVQSPKQLAWPTHALSRPLLQESPKKIPPPESALKFTERLAWFDEEGKNFERDYFIARGKGKWIWVFRDQQDEWFQQGVVE
jgi:hypothetical protein